jgi:hypothetical protein
MLVNDINNTDRKREANFDFIQQAFYKAVCLFVRSQITPKMMPGSSFEQNYLRKRLRTIQEGLGLLMDGD